MSNNSYDKFSSAITRKCKICGEKAVGFIGNGIPVCLKHKGKSIRKRDPIDAIFEMMQKKGLSRRDLAPAFGTRSRVSDALNRKRPLTLAQIKVLHNRFGIDASILLQDYPCEQNWKEKETEE